MGTISGVITRTLDKRIVPAVAVLALALSLGACTTSSDDDDDDDSGGGPILVIAASGDLVDISGTWTRCYESGDSGSDEQEVQVFDGDEFTYTGYAYSSNGGACSADEEVAEGPLTGDVEGHGEFTTDGWTNGTTCDDGPPAGLPDPAEATLLHIEIDDEELSALRFVDDSVEPWLMYREADEGTCDSDDDGVTNVLHSLDPLEKQD
jgi:hypothetical protein